MVRGNIAFRMTPAGAGAIAVVRLCGDAVVPFLDAHFSRALERGSAGHGELRDGERIIDDPVVVLASERVADVCLHGGPWVVHECLELAARSGFAVTGAQTPLPAEAFEADSELEREVLTHLPLARTKEALHALLSQPEIWSKFKSLRPDEQALQRVLDDVSLHWLLHRPRVAIAGPANAGKSTLANQLFGQEHSITADVPGTTRDWVGEMANLDGLAVMLIDTPGIRLSTDAIEMQAIERARQELERADLVVLVLDATRPAEPEQSALLARFPSAIRVLNKVDQPTLWTPEGKAIRTIASSGDGVDLVRAAIRSAFGCEPLGATTPRCWTERQREILMRALSDPETIREV